MKISVIGKMFVWKIKVVKIDVTKLVLNQYKDLDKDG